MNLGDSGGGGGNVVKSRLCVGVEAGRVDQLKAGRERTVMKEKKV